MKEKRKDRYEDENRVPKKKTYQVVQEKQKLAKAKRDYEKRQNAPKEDPVESNIEIQNLQMKQLLESKGSNKDDAEDFELDMKNTNQKPLTLEEQMKIIDQIQPKTHKKKQNTSEEIPKEVLAKSRYFYCHFELVGCKKYEQDERIGRCTVVNDNGDVVYDVYVNQPQVVNTRNIHPVQYEQNQKLEEKEVIAKLKTYPKLFGFVNVLKLKNFTAIQKDGLTFDKMVSINLGYQMRKNNTSQEKAKFVSALVKAMKLK